MAFGDSATTVRALSALLGTLTIPVIYLLGRRQAGDDKVGLLAALVLAVSPFHVRFAQETRMYTLLTLNASLALYALVCLLTDPRPAEIPPGERFVGRWPAWLGYVVFTTTTLLSHNTAVFFPIATNVFVLGLMLVRVSGIKKRGSGSRNLKPETLKPETTVQRLQPPPVRHWILAQAGVLLLWSPWFLAFVKQSIGVYREFWIPPPTWQTIWGTVGTFLSAFLPHQVRWLQGAWGLYAVLLLLGLIHFRRCTARIGLLAVMFLTPFVGEWLVSLRRPIFYDRTLIWASLPLYVLIAAGMRQLRRRSLIFVAVSMALAVNGFSLREYYTHFEKEEWNDAAAFVAEHVEPNDLILFNATWVQIPFDYYFRPYDRPVAEHGVPVDLFDRGILEPKMAASDLSRLRTLVQGRERVWLVYSHNWYTDPQELIPPALEEDLDWVGQWRFYGLEVRLYEAD
jgi:mannosyltransferase